MANDGAVILERKRYSYRGMDFWPESGLIHLEDQSTGEYTVVTRRDTLLRAKAINDTIHYYPHASERNEQHKLVSELIECVRAAKAQGDPDDKTVAAYKAREIRRARRSKLVGAGDTPPARVLGAPVPLLDSGGIHPAYPIDDRLLHPNIPSHRERR